ncbi:hypothetical protein CTAYLR_007477 [Chrysophaeum taylorii]|uniref:Uncharacterized protein n=1 Tax=Chrysophaeum taylorii TaxID=2483200 RepID=A0AAD7UDY4_9STRA|nr:hypothetical protein CTAYLR_007477 [Chrysophaeum taylorii]
MHPIFFLLAGRGGLAPTTSLCSDNVKYDVGSGWKPQEGGMQSTDTPDFFYEDGDSRNPSVDFTDGIMGSTGLDKLRSQSGNDPGVAGALDVDPTKIGGYQAASAAAKGVKFELDVQAQMGRFADEIAFSMPAASDQSRISDVFIKPVCMAYEDFYAGFTADSASCFSVEPTEGRMDRRGGEPTMLTIECKPDGKPGSKLGYLCVVLPDEGEQFTVKVTADFV